MIRRKTCFVLGAGASVPFGFPSGPRLRQIILTEVGQANTEPNVVLRAMGFGPTVIKEFVAAFGASKQESIDAFLAHRGDYEPIGKAAIAAVLIAREDRSALHAAEEDDWISYLWTRLQDTGPERFGDNNLSIVSFNYDRSVERALIDAYIHSFRATPEDAADAIRGAIPIVKVHGSLGKLSERSGAEGRLYRPEVAEWSVCYAAQEIQILSKAESTSPDFERARRLILEADRVVFLGCAYHEMNMKRLNVRDGQPGHRIGSGYRLKEFERQRIRSVYGISVGNGSWKSLDFLRETVDLLD